MKGRPLDRKRHERDAANRAVIATWRTLVANRDRLGPEARAFIEQHLDQGATT